MTDELVQAVNGIDRDRSTKVIKTDALKKINPDILLMVLYCLQPTVRAKISIFNVNKGETLPDTILRSICKCKFRSLFFSARFQLQLLY